MIRIYLELKNFKHFTLEYGDIFGNDYDLSFPIADLYESRISNQKINSTYYVDIDHQRHTSLL